MSSALVVFLWARLLCIEPSACFFELWMCPRTEGALGKVELAIADSHLIDALKATVPSLIKCSAEVLMAH